MVLAGLAARDRGVDRSMALAVREGRWEVAAVRGVAEAMLLRRLVRSKAGGVDGAALLSYPDIEERYLCRMKI